MGRPPKPTEQKRLLGNPGKRRLPEPVIAIEPVGAAQLPNEAASSLPAVVIPDPPKGLRRAGKEAWLRLWTAAHGWLSQQTDWDLLIRLCQLHDERAQLLKIMRVAHIPDDLDVLAEVLDERQDIVALEDALDERIEGSDRGAVIRVLFRRVRALEQRLEAGGGEPSRPEAGKSQEKGTGTKRPRGRAPMAGYFALGSKGQLVLHPAVKSLRLVDAEIRRLESLCGFNPSDRSRLGLAEVKKISKLEQLLQERGARARGSGGDGEEPEEAVEGRGAPPGGVAGWRRGEGAGEREAEDSED